MTTQENPHAGEGPVVLDIGGDVGALVVTTPAAMEGLEVEIVPTGTAAPTPRRTGIEDHHDTGHGHGHGHADGSMPPHVAVVPRAVGTTVVHALVYPELVEGTYDLYVRPDGPVVLTATVHGGQVTECTWPTDQASA